MHSSSPGHAVVRLQALGRDLTLRCDPGDLRTLECQWRRCGATRVDAPLTGDYEVDEPREGGAEDYLYAVQMRVTLAAIAAATGQLLMWHAAGLAAPDGRVVGLLARSGTGKTSAATFLARHGWGYVTDETLATDPSGRVLPYAKPLAFRGRAPGKASLGPDELQLEEAPEHLVLHRLVVLDRDDNRTDPAAMTRLSRAEALLALVEQSSGLMALDRPLALLADTLDHVGGLWRLTYRDIAEAAPLLSKLVDDPIPEPVADDLWAPEDRRPTGDLGPVDPGGNVLWRAPYADAVSFGQGTEVLLVVGSTPAHLRGIGVDIWRAADGGITDSEMTELVQRAHGPHPQASTLVNRAVDELVQASVLIRGRRPAAAR